MTAPSRTQRIERRFDDLELDAEQRWYLRYNARRYRNLVETVAPLLVELRARFPDQAPRVLDVAISFQTELVRDLVPDGTVDDLGHRDPHFRTPPDARHIEYDLNDARLPERQPPVSGYHLVLFCETIEHLWVGPRTVLSALARGLETGGFLVVQTPNAVALHKRLRMAAGRSPLAPLPEGDRPGVAHLHEYTIGELVGAAADSGLELSRLTTANHFGSGWAARAYGWVGRVTPPSLRHGITATFVKRG